MILISGPAIGKLCARTRKWAHERLHRGSFGAVIRGPGGVLYADLSGVEQYTGLQFTADQLEDVREGRPRPVRVITIPGQEVD